MLRGLAVLLAFVTLVGVAAELYLRSRSRGHGQHMEVAAERELLGGGLQGLLRARSFALGGAAVAADDDAAATVALSSAILASEYGLEEANAALAAADVVAAMPRASQRAQALKLASQALVELTRDHPDRAEALARESVALGHKQSSPLFALGRVRAHQGNLAAASHALQAALVREPGFMEARVAAAEVWLELGQRAKAKEQIAVVLRRTPDHGRAVLLKAEIDRAESADDGATWEATCTRDEGKSPFVASACDLARAERAWRIHDRGAAIALAAAAARRRPSEPRILGRAAQLLASLGAVDQAAVCLQEGLRIASPALPSLRWAQIAVDLGRGQLASPPHDIGITSSSWAPLLLARIALASGGPAALAAALPGLRDGGGGLAELAASVAPGDGDAEAMPQASADPLAAYVRGLAARLDGKPTLAARWLEHALHGYGDACRAVGEYVAVLRELERSPERAAFAPLARENSGCVNLAAALTASAQPGKRARRAAPVPH